MVLAVGLSLELATLWRRSRPLAPTVVGFATFAVVDLASYAAGREPFEAYAGTVVLVLLYSVFRWGTPWQSAIGLAVALVEWVVVLVTEVISATGAGGGLVVLLFVAALGAAVRYREVGRVQRIEQVRSHEREVLARVSCTTPSRTTCRRSRSRRRPALFRDHG